MAKLDSVKLKASVDGKVKLAMDNFKQAVENCGWEKVSFLVTEATSESAKVLFWCIVSKVEYEDLGG